MSGPARPVWGGLLLLLLLALLLLVVLAKIWRRGTEPPARQPLSQTALQQSPVWNGLAGGYRLEESTHNTLKCVDSSGVTVWEASSNICRLPDSPWPLEEVIYALENRNDHQTGAIVGFSPQGRKLWEIPHDHLWGPSGTVDHSGVLSAIDAENTLLQVSSSGELLWTGRVPTDMDCDAFERDTVSGRVYIAGSVEPEDKTAMRFLEPLLILLPWYNPGYTPGRPVLRVLDVRGRVLWQYSFPVGSWLDYVELTASGKVRVLVSTSQFQGSSAAEYLFEP